MKPTVKSVPMCLFIFTLCLSWALKNHAIHAANTNFTVLAFLDQGILLGKRSTFKGYVWEQFMGIPYAEPPTGPLRFRPPVPHKGWSNGRDARESRVKCPQDLAPYRTSTSEEKEDCLLLDVYVPCLNTISSQTPLPTMIFLHGGAFNYEEKTFYPGSALTRHDIIVISINYRLGILGFFSTGSKEAGGNWGLMDQHMAIKWVRKNIEKFGGDPNKITIFGESAGGRAAVLQMLSPYNKGLFKRVIAQSGTAFSRYTLDRTNRVKHTSFEVARRCNCTNDNTTQMVECLRGVDWTELARMQANDTMAPVIDGDFLPKAPEYLYNVEIAQNISLMTGINQGEGFLFLNPTRDTTKPAIQALTQQYENPDVVSLAFESAYPELVNSKNRTSIEFLKKAVDFFTDVRYSAGAERDAYLHSRNGGRTYKYLLQYPTKLHIFYTGVQLPDWILNTHGDEVPYVFGFPEFQIPEVKEFYPKLTNETFNGDDAKLSNMMMTMWTNFAKTGDPNQGTPIDGIHWPEYNTSIPNVFVFDTRLIQLNQSRVITTKNSPDLLRPDKNKFWNELVPQIETRCTEKDTSVDVTTTDVDVTTAEVEVSSTTTTLRDSATSSVCTGGKSDKCFINQELITAVWILGMLCGVLCLITIVLIDVIITKNRKTKTAILNH